MDRQELTQFIFQQKSFLCVGLDSDIDRIPSFLLDYEDPVFEFNKRIIDTTKNYCVAYKPNLAFYEARGSAGWDSLTKTIGYIPRTHFKIADAKRGDIGNTAAQYAKTFFETLNFDAVTLSPYMGVDSINPFLEYQNKWVIVLGLTSNKGNRDVQFIRSDSDRYVFEEVLLKGRDWGNISNLMFVVGATQNDYFKLVREHIPDHFLLVPGIGAQGGSLEDVYNYLANEDVGILVNSSRSILFASSNMDFAERSGQAAQQVQTTMAKLLQF